MHSNSSLLLCDQINFQRSEKFAAKEAELSKKIQSLTEEKTTIKTSLIAQLENAKKQHTEEKKKFEKVYYLFYIIITTYLETERSGAVGD